MYYLNLKWNIISNPMYSNVRCFNSKQYLRMQVRCFYVIYILIYTIRVLVKLLNIMYIIETDSREGSVLKILLLCMKSIWKPLSLFSLWMDCIKMQKQGDIKFETMCFSGDRLHLNSWLFPLTKKKFKKYPLDNYGHKYK